MFLITHYPLYLRSESAEAVYWDFEEVSHAVICVKGTSMMYMFITVLVAKETSSFGILIKTNKYIL